MDIEKLAQKAERSAFYRFLLSRSLGLIVPFNRPHNFKVKEIGRENLKLKLPYKKRNMNHLKGLHACALATLAELTSGCLLMIRLDPAKYRLILQKLEMEYHYQARGDAFAEYSIEEDWLKEMVTLPLQHEDSVLLHCEVAVRDENDKLLATGIAYWQVKSWSKVKTDRE